MDNVRAIVWVTFLALAWLVYSTWSAEHAPPPAPAVPTAETPAGPPASGRDTLPPLDSTPTPSTTAISPPGAPDSTPQPAQLVHVRTDVFDAWIDLHGGDLVRTDLPKYPMDKK